MKVFFVQDALVNAGAERSHMEIISRFSAQVEASLVYFYPKHELRSAYQAKGVRTIFLDIPKSYNFHLAIARLVKLIRAEKPDLMVSCLWRADIISRIAALMTGTPLVGTLVNDSYSGISWSHKKGLKHRVVYWLDRATSSIPKYWISNSQALVDSHKKTLGLPNLEATVIYRGREIVNYSECHRNGIKQFVSYGRLLERKGFQDAIFAFKKVCTLFPTSTFTIYGEGKFRPQLEALISSLGLSENVKLPGEVIEPQKLLGKFDCFIFPSWYEGFSGALVEAMLSGIPIISSDISMNLEAVSDQESALIFPVRNQEILSEKLLWAINHPKEMIGFGDAARDEAINRFDINKVSAQYESVLLDFLSRTLANA